MPSRNLKVEHLISLLIAAFLISIPVRAGYGSDANDLTPSTQTNQYVFQQDRSSLIQSGGIAGIRRNYSVKGKFDLTINFEAGTALLKNVDANAIDESSPEYTLDPNEVFNITSLEGLVINDTRIEFTGQSHDGSDVNITVTFEDDLIHLIAETTPPPNSADFFIFEMDAIAKRKYNGGTGESNNPYLIHTAEQMNAIGTKPNDWDKHFKLTADIDLSAFDGTDDRPYFNMIGYYIDCNDDMPFTGIFNGNSHTISNLNITSSDDLVGLFRYVGKPGEIGVIKDLRLIDPNIQTQKGIGVGSLIGWLSWGTVMNCHVNDGIIRGNTCVGGLVGYTDKINPIYNNSLPAINNSSSTTDVSGNLYVGGLVGENQGIITDSDANSIVTGENWVGGLVGSNGEVIPPGGLIPGLINNCYSSGTVTGYNRIGGLLGINCGKVIQSYSTSDVHSYGSNVGGLVGYNYSIITDSYAAGSISGYTFVGGLVGTNGIIIRNGFWKALGEITNCYSTGSASGISSIGGLVGYNEIGLVTSSIWDIETSGQAASDGGIGKTTAEMQMLSTFTDVGWDFVGETADGTKDIWWIDEGRDYPRLWWELSTSSPYPQNGAVDVIQPVVMSWIAGGNNLNHDIYFGEDEQAVADATAESPGIYRGRQSPEITNYNPGPLKLNKTYYWRIDEISTDAIIGKGNVWNFTTADFLVVDDFESYNDLDNHIFDKWIDGWDIPANGAFVEILHDIDPCWGLEYCVNVPRVFGGHQSMAYVYDNTDATYSEATKMLAWPRNWTQDGVGVLSLWFNGYPTNAPEFMYLALANRSGPPAFTYHNNSNASRIDEWIQWKIDLQLFTNNDVDLTDIDRISIGFGDINNPQPGGWGQVCFDDIRLYQSSQEPEL